MQLQKLIDIRTLIKLGKTSKIVKIINITNPSDNTLHLRLRRCHRRQVSTRSKRTRARLQSSFFVFRFWLLRNGWN